MWLEGNLWLLVVLFILIVLSGTISAMETSLTAVSQSRIYSLAKQNIPAAKRVLELLHMPKRFIGAILLSNNLINIFMSSLTTSVFLKMFGENGVVYSTIVVTALIVIFGEIFPKTLAIAKSVELSMILSWPARALVVIFSPAVLLIQYVTDSMFHVFGINAKGIVDEDVAREELRGAIHLSHDSGGVYKDELKQLGGLLDLRDLSVADVMIHRKSMVTLDRALPTPELNRQMLKTPYTRIPLYQDNHENIVGILHAKDMLRAIIDNENGIDGVALENVIRKPWFIPDTTPLTMQLNKFLSSRNHFAIVVDEYGDLQGMITLEDILEEIVGDIRDEHDVALPGMRRQPDGSYIVDGTTPVRDLNRKTDLQLPDENYTTIAGLIIHEARMIPEKGQSFYFYGVRFEVLERKRNQIKKVRVVCANK